MSEAVPTVKWKQSKMKHWFSPETLHLIRVKRRIYRQMKQRGTDLLKSKYKAISNLVCSQTRKDTIAHVNNLSTSKPKKFWSFLNYIKSRRHPIPPLKDNDALVSDDTDKATIFNKYFHSIFTAENCDDLSILHQSLTHHPDLIDSIDFTIEEVHAELSNLQQDKKLVVQTISLLTCYRKVLIFLLHPSPSYFNFLFQLGFCLETGLRLTSSQYIRKVTDIYHPTISQLV